jgi:hypothetical protein
MKTINLAVETKRRARDVIGVVRASTVIQNKKKKVKHKKREVLDETV